MLMISKNEDRKHTLEWVFPGKAQVGGQGGGDRRGAHLKFCLTRKGENLSFAFFLKSLVKSAHPKENFYDPPGNCLYTILH